MKARKYESKIPIEHIRTSEDLFESIMKMIEFLTLRKLFKTLKYFFFGLNMIFYQGFILNNFWKNHPNPQRTPDISVQPKVFSVRLLKDGTFIWFTVPVYTRKTWKTVVSDMAKILPETLNVVNWNNLGLFFKNGKWYFLPCAIALGIFLCLSPHAAAITRRLKRGRWHMWMKRVSQQRLEF